MGLGQPDHVISLVSLMTSTQPRATGTPRVFIYLLILSFIHLREKQRMSGGEEGQRERISNDSLVGEEP